MVAHIEGGTYNVENVVLTRIFGAKTDEVPRGGEDYIIRSLMICILHQILE